MKIFGFIDYRAFLRSFISKLPKKGRGELTRIAVALRMSTTLLSHVMSGSRDFTMEQGCEICALLKFTEFETDYFLLMLQYSRANSKILRDRVEKKLRQMRADAEKLSNRVVHEKKLSDNERAVFYSTWIFSAIHLFTTLERDGVTLENIAERFQIVRQRAAEIMQFLVSTGLCVEHLGRYRAGVISTFVERGSPHLLKHHSNWRVKAIQKSENLLDSEMMYTGQMSLSKTDFAKVREKLTEVLSECSLLVKDSPPEDIAALHIDWFWIDK